MLLSGRLVAIGSLLLLTLMSAGGITSAAETSARFALIKTFQDSRLQAIQKRFSRTDRTNSGAGTYFAYSHALKIDPVTPWPWNSKKDRAVLRDAIRTVLTGYKAPDRIEISGPISKSAESTFRRFDTMLVPVWSERSRESFIPGLAATLRETDESIQLYRGEVSNGFGFGQFLVIADIPNREILVLGMQYAE